MHHRELVRLAPREAVHDVECKIEFVLVVELQPLQRAVFLFHAVDELVAEQLLLRRLLERPRPDGQILLLLGARHDHREEHTVLPVDGDHAVRCGALVEDAVALVEDFLVFADAHAERPLHDEVKFLSGMRRGVDGLALQLLGILIGDPIRRRQLLPEHCRHVLNGDAVLAGRYRAHAPARHRVARELGALAFEQIGQLHAERQRTLVHERKREIDRALLIAVILLDADLGLLGHLRLGVADDLAHFADSLCDLHQRIGGRLLGLHHHSGFLLC